MRPSCIYYLIFIQNKNSREQLKKYFLTLILTFIDNLTWLLQWLQVCRSRGNVNCSFRKPKMKMLQEKKRKQTMAPTGKVTPSGKWHNTETVEPECLQSQAVYLLCPTLAAKICRLTLLGWKEKNEGFHSKTTNQSSKKYICCLIFFNIKVDIFLKYYFVKKKKNHILNIYHKEIH